MSGTDENTSCVFEAGILCPFREQPNDAPERMK